jgi:alpha-1,2-mannosyltransferase
LRRIGPALLVINAIVAVVQAFGRHDVCDLETYRLGIAAWLDKGDPYGELPPTTSGIRLPFIYPPFAAIVMLPFQLVRLEVAAGAMDLLSTFALGAVLWLALRELKVGSRALVVGVALPIALRLEPVRYTVNLGQINILLLAMVLADCLIAWRGKGVLVGLAIAIKLTPAVFLGFFLLRKEYRAALAAGVSFALATAIGFVFAPGPSVTYWTKVLFDTGNRVGRAFGSNQSIAGELARLMTPGPAQGALWALGVLVLLAVATLAAREAARAGDSLLTFSIVALFGLLASPLSWSNHWVWLIPLMLWLLVNGIRERNTTLGVAGAVLFLLLMLGLHWKLPTAFERERSWTFAQHLAGNSYLIAGLVLMIGAALRRVTR